MDHADELEIGVSAVPPRSTPAPNSVVTLPGGLGYVVLNEQVCDGGDATVTEGSATSTCPDTDGDGHTGITVRAVRVVLLDGVEPGGLVEIVVAESVVLSSASSTPGPSRREPRAGHVVF